MSVFEELGPLALASRLKQLSETLSKEVSAVYQKLDISFEARWFTLFWTLKAQNALTITELAKELRQTHAAIVQLTNLLEKKGLLVSQKDKQDERRRRVSLSQKGLLLFKEVEPVLQAIEQANKDLLLLASPDFLGGIEMIEQALEEKPMYDRILDNLQLYEQGYSVSTYDPAYKEDFIGLNRLWIEENFGALEEADRRVLERPEEEIIAKGGMVFFALHQGNAVGTAAIEEEGSEVFRISKFAVQKELRGRGIGKALLKKAVAFAKARGGKVLTLYTSAKMVESVNFYIRQGFVLAPLTAEEQNLFRRAGIKMQMELPGQKT
ncbi:bifunctional helix-turn-helix transcriptional regulator/GNAT family N-acetyltransferase [Nafulsella turpanensis]|uniref:bifunctional helix-turn-helix transcriptional regulator/GNAT family N-acetyltransferase n=1 Tax=Nafulsella turpanensis TaxID=1265690 RepID=UPI00034AE284|nr:bifunctional helix-turn-helix transcriptional regulator/GNAT family N-acetyltransferase [Nafulsella turpanensis]